MIESDLRTIDDLAMEYVLFRDQPNPSDPEKHLIQRYVLLNYMLFRTDTKEVYQAIATARDILKMCGVE